MSATYQPRLLDVQTTQPKKTIESVLACLDSIPTINAGGCGISALAIYRWCQKNGIDVSDRPFVILCEDEWDADALNSHLERGDIDNAWFHHIAIQIDGTLYDSTGNLYEIGWEGADVPCPTQLNETELLYALNELPGWNSDFSRRRYVPIIEFGLGIDLSDVKVRGL